jgi:hypothetical protein
MGAGLRGIEARCGLVPSSMAQWVDEDDRRRREVAGHVRDEEGRVVEDAEIDWLTVWGEEG